MPDGKNPVGLTELSLQEWEKEVWGEESQREFRTAPTGPDGIHIDGGPELELTR